MGTPDFLAGGGELGALMRAADWTRSPLGPPSHWPNSLKTLVRVILTSRQPMFVWWGEHLINLYNDAYRSILGGKHPAALGQPASVVWREIWDQVGPRAEQALRGNEGTYDEALLLIMERNGYPEETHYTFSYSPVPGDDGAIGGIFCANTDDTQRIIGERQVMLLRELAARTVDARTTQEACERAAGALETDARDVPFALLFLSDNTGSGPREGPGGGEGRPPRLAATAGVPPASDLRNAKAWPLTNPPELLDVRNLPHLPRGDWDRPPEHAALLPIAASGRDKPAGVLVVGLNPYRLYDDTYRGFLGLVAGQIAAVVANAGSYEAERRRAEALAEIDRAKTAFFSNASHEFRTPLTLMLGPVEQLLTIPGQEIPASREDLELVRRNGLRLQKLVNTLLDFSRIEAGRMQATYEPIDLAAFTADLASTFRSAMQRAGLNYEVACPPLPEQVPVDRDMWEKIVLNLVSNAFKYTLTGQVSVRLQARDGLAELTVQDTGVGIPAHELPRIFDRFHRIAGQHGRTHEGSGIGLALVNELVRLHGGTVEVTSTLGRGSSFHVRIPLGRTHLPADRIADATAASARGVRAESFVEEALRWLPGEDPTPAPEIRHDFYEPEAERAPTRRPVVLLADDNADMREYVRRLLNPRFDVHTAPDGEAALRAARNARPDLVMTDVMMPRLDGFGLLRALRAEPDLREVPVIMLSARAGEEARVEGLEAGVDDYLVKPFSARELVARVESNVTLSRLRRQAAARERTLREEAETERRRFETVVQNLTFGVGVFEPGGKLVLANAAMEPMLGISPLATHSFADFLQWRTLQPDGSPIPLDRSSVWRALHGETIRDELLLYRRPDDTLRWFRATAIPLTDTAGTITAAIAVYVDVDEEVRSAHALRDLNQTLETRVTAEIADRMKAEAALRQAQKMEAIGQLTGGIAHDFNNLLQVIVGNLESLRRRAASGMVAQDVVERFSANALRGAERGAQLTQRLLAFARRQALQPRVLDANSVLSGMSDLLRRTLGENVRLEVALAAKPALVLADPNQLENTLLNLAVNARDAMPDGGTLRLEVDSTQDPEIGPAVDITVSDTGTGMPPDIIDLVFEPFFTTKPAGQGTGLGLSQVYGFVRQSGGTVRLTSSPGRGTTVRLLLPCAEGVPQDRPDSGALFVTGGNETVLLVEDDPEVRSQSAAALRDLGYQVLEAPDGPAALATLRNDREIRLLFTDIGLPGMNGRALAEQARADRPDLAVIFTTGYAHEALTAAELADPATALLPKPFTYAALDRLIRDVLSREYAPAA